MQPDDVAVSPPHKAKLPLELRHSGVKFAIFGYQNRRREVSVKSEDAPLELLGFYPLEAIEVSTQGRLKFLWELLDLSSVPVHWIMSLPFRTKPESPGSDQLVLIWQGLATRNDKLAIKKTLDRNAINIAEGTMLADYWGTAISVSPVIAECRRAENKNRRVGVTLWICAAILIVLWLTLTRC
jgi:hypothetical protein